LSSNRCFSFPLPSKIYLRSKLFAEVRNWSAEENKELIIFVGVGVFPSNRRGDTCHPIVAVLQECRTLEVSWDWLFRKQEDCSEKQNHCFWWFGDWSSKNIFHICPSVDLRLLRSANNSVLIGSQCSRTSLEERCRAPGKLT